MDDKHITPKDAKGRDVWLFAPRGRNPLSVQVLGEHAAIPEEGRLAAARFIAPDTHEVVAREVAPEPVAWGVMTPEGLVVRTSVDKDVTTRLADYDGDPSTIVPLYLAADVRGAQQ